MIFIKENNKLSGWHSLMLGAAAVFHIIENKYKIKS